MVFTTYNIKVQTPQPTIPRPPQQTIFKKWSINSEHSIVQDPEEGMKFRENIALTELF